MISKVLKVGDKVEMKRVETVVREDGQEALFNSQLIDIQGSDKLNISIPIKGGAIIPLEVGERYELRFVTSSGIYKCKAEISNRGKQGVVYYLGMMILSELQKDQRRQYFRLDKIKQLEYHKLSREEGGLLAMLAAKKYNDEFERRALRNKLNNIETEDHDGTVLNISGGGIKFNSKDELKQGDFIRIKIFLEDTDTEPLDLFARVIASEYIPNKSIHNEHRIEFVNINRDTREKIIKYVFNEDRKQRQKEKGSF